MKIPAAIVSQVIIFISLSVNGDKQWQVNAGDEVKNYLANKTLIVSVVVREPFVIFNKNRKSRKQLNERSEISNSSSSSPVDHVREADISDPDNYSGVAVEVFKRLAFTFKFSYRFVRPHDNLFGSQQADGSWNGIVGDVYYNVSDIGLTALSITLERSRAVDFSRAYFVETTSILVRIPEEEKNYFAIFQPFSMLVWLILLATVLGLIVLIQLMTWLQDWGQPEGPQLTARSARAIGSSRSARQEAKHIHRGAVGHLWARQFYYSVSCVINILLIRDIEEPPRQNPIRIMVCVWWLCTIAIVNIYFGILFSQLVVPRLPPSIDSLEELANQNQVKWSVTRGSALYDLFKSSTKDSVYARIGANMENATTVDQGIERTLTQGWAFIREKSILSFKLSEYHTRLRQCKMKLAKEEFFSVGFGIAIKKGAPYLSAFDRAIGRMIENGLVARWQAKYWPPKNVYTQCDMGPSEGEPLGMKHFLSIYLVCSLIMSASLGVLLYQSTHEHIFVSQMKPLILDTLERFRNHPRPSPSSIKSTSGVRIIAI